MNEQGVGAVLDLIQNRRIHKATICMQLTVNFTRQRITGFEHPWMSLLPLKLEANIPFGTQIRSYALFSRATTVHLQALQFAKNSDPRPCESVPNLERILRGRRNQR